MTSKLNTSNRWHLVCLKLFVAAAFLFSILLSGANDAYACKRNCNSVGHTDGGSRGGKGGSGIGVGAGIGLAIGVGTLISESSKKQKKKEKKSRKKKKYISKKKTRKTPKRKVAAPRRAPLPVPLNDAVSNEVVLAFAANISNDVIDSILSTYGLRRLEQAIIPLLNKQIVRAFGSGQLSTGRRRQLEADPRVNVTNNYIYRLSGSAQLQYAVSRLNINEAHKTVQGDGIKIAIIDSGVQLSHPALSTAALVQLDVLPAKRKITDSHGTAIASIIAAQNGMTGIAPNAELLSIRAFAPARKKTPAQGTSFNLVKALNAAYLEGAQIVNMSFAGPNDALFHEAVQAAYGHELVLVAAAGNKGPKAKPAFPAAYNEVIAVTATDGKDRLYRHANRGNYVAVAAPGVDVLVAQKKKGFGFMSGTSMAAAYVSGAAALLLQKDPALPADHIDDILALSADDLGPKGKDRRFGHGLINVQTAMDQYAGQYVADNHGESYTRTLNEGTPTNQIAGGAAR